MQKKITIIHIFLLVSLAFCQSNKKNLSLGRQFLAYPQKYFVSSYEKAIFQRFKNRFPNINLKDVIAIQNNYLLEIFIVKEKKPYKLMLEMDTQERITSVYRYLSKDIIKSRKKSDAIILKWLGKFFYRLDAGDSAALHDMIFHEKNRIRYNNLSNKSEIVAQLFRKFQSIVPLSEINYQEQTSFYSIIASIPFSSDIFFQIAHEWVEVKDSDLLQRNLYQRIISALNKNESLESSMRFKSKLELLKYLKEYYPETIEQGDIFVVPYPQTLKQEIKEIRFKIKENTKQPGYNSINIDPILNFEFKQDKSILIFNKSCNISYYSPPYKKIRNLERTEQLLKKIFNMFLLFPFTTHLESYKDLTGEVYFRGYDVYKIELTINQQWSNFWQVLRNEGSIYFYPTKIDDFENEIVIGGFIYIIKDKRMDSYHFGELTIHVSDNMNDISLVMKLNFYPFINRTNVVDFNGSVNRP